MKCNQMISYHWKCMHIHPQTDFRPFAHFWACLWANERNHKCLWTIQYSSYSVTFWIVHILFYITEYDIAASAPLTAYTIINKCINDKVLRLFSGRISDWNSKRIYNFCLYAFDARVCEHKHIQNFFICAVHKHIHIYNFANNNSIKCVHIYAFEKWQIYNIWIHIYIYSRIFGS